MTFIHGLVDLEENKVSIKKGIFYVFIANLINLIISLFSGFILPKYLSVDTYAYIKLFHLYITYIGITHLGYSDGMYLRIGGKKLETIDKKEVLEEFKTFKYFQYIVSILAILVSLIIRNEMLLFCSIVIIPINVSNYIRHLYTAIGQFKKYSTYTNINTFFIFGINIILLFIIKSDYYYMYIVAQIVVYFLYWLFIEYEVRKIFGHEKVSFNAKFIIEDIKSGFLLLIGNFCNVIFTSIDRVFVKKLIGLTQFAYYSFATSIESLMNVFITPISTVMYNYFCNKKEKDSVIKVKKYLLIFSSIVVLTIFPAKFIVNIWLTKYQESISVLFLLVSAQYIAIMVRSVHMNLYKAEKKQNRYFKIMILVVIISVILNIVGYIIGKSMISIAVATMITNIIWYTIGELDFKEYRLSFIDYMYTFVILISFLMCGILLNAIEGFLVYSIILILMAFTFEKNCLLELIKEGKRFIKTKLRIKLGKSLDK